MLVFQSEVTSRSMLCLEHDRSNFLRWVFPEPTKNVTELGLLFTNEEELIKEMAALFIVTMKL